MDAFVQRMKNAMQRGRSAILPPGWFSCVAMGTWGANLGGSRQHRRSGGGGGRVCGGELYER